MLPEKERKCVLRWRVFFYVSVLMLFFTRVLFVVFF